MPGRLKLAMPGRPGAALLVSATAFALAVLSTNIVNLALPRIQSDFGGGIAGIQWVSNAYTLTLATLLLSMGVLCDRIGARRVMILGLSLFACGGFVAMVSPSIEILILAQTIKGAGGAAMVPASLALLSHAYNSHSKQAHAVAFVAGASAVATAAGPVLAGFMIDTASWRSIFAIDVIGALLVLWPTVKNLSETARGAKRQLDFPGQITAIVALAALTFAIISTGARGLGAPATLVSFAVALSAGAIFALVERRSVDPMLPPALFRLRAFDVASACGVLVNFAFYGELFILSLYLQDVRGLSPLEAGWVFLPLPIAAAFSAIPAGRMTARRGARLPSALGCAVGAVGVLILATTVSASSPYWIFIAGLILMGLGPGLAVPALTAALVSGVPRANAGIAAAAFTGSRQVGGLLGVAVFGALVGAGNFVPQMRVTLFLAAGAMLAAALVGGIFVRRGVGVSTAESTVADMAAAVPASDS